MINKFALSRAQNVKYVRENLEQFIENNLILSRYEQDDPLRETAYENLKTAYEFVLSNPDVENDYKCLLTLHEMLMKGLEYGLVDGGNGLHRYGLDGIDGEASVACVGVVRIICSITGIGYFLIIC